MTKDLENQHRRDILLSVAEHTESDVERILRFLDEIAFILQVGFRFKSPSRILPQKKQAEKNVRYRRVPIDGKWVLVKASF